VPNISKINEHKEKGNTEYSVVSKLRTQSTLAH